jgi:hypothetical protein
MTSANPWRAGYYETRWPSEHTDLWRSHCVFDGGLPAEAFRSPGFPRLQVATAKLNLPVWGYSRARDEIFVIGGSPVALASFTNSIMNGAGGATGSPASTDADMVSIPYVAKMNPFTMQVTAFEMSLGKTINYTGGLLMHANGFVYAVAQSVLYKIDPITMLAVRTLQLPLVGESPSANFQTTYNGMQVLATGKLVLKGFGFVDNADVDGWLLLIDPDSLAIDVQQSAMVSSARLTIQQSTGGPTYLYLVNATQSLRYRITESGFDLDTPWTSVYRDESSGSTQASSPLFYGKIGYIAFADNTAPGATTPIRLYVQPSEVAASAPALPGSPAFTTQLPGFNFFMVAGDPFSSQLVVYYDPINCLLSAHRFNHDGGLVLVWERNIYKPSASPAVVIDSDILYIDDYRDGKDHFVVLRLSTGEELASVPLDATLPTIGTIFVGMNEDVFIISSEAGTSDGLISRIRVADSQ